MLGELVPTSDDEELAETEARVLAPDSQPERRASPPSTPPQVQYAVNQLAEGSFGPALNDSQDARLSSSSDRTERLPSSDLPKADEQDSASPSSQATVLLSEDRGPPSRTSTPDIGTDRLAVQADDETTFRRTTDREATPLGQPARSSAPPKVSPLAASTELVQFKESRAEISDDEMDLLASQWGPPARSEPVAPPAELLRVQDERTLENGMLPEADTDIRADLLFTGHGVVEDSVQGTVPSPVRATPPRATPIEPAASSSSSIGPHRSSSLETAERPAAASRNFVLTTPPRTPPQASRKERLGSAPLTPLPIATALQQGREGGEERSPRFPLPPFDDDMPPLDEQNTPLPSPQPRSSQLNNTASRTHDSARPQAGSLSEEERRKEAAAVAVDSPMQLHGRALRSRKPAQMNPFTWEHKAYERILQARDWEGAIVSRREALKEAHRKAQEQGREIADALRLDKDWLELDETEREKLRLEVENERKEKEARKAAREAKRAEKEARRAEREAKRAEKEAIRASKAKKQGASSRSPVYTENASRSAKGKQRADDGGSSASSDDSLPKARPKKRVKHTFASTRALSDNDSDASSSSSSSGSGDDSDASFSADHRRRQGRSRRVEPMEEDLDEEEQMRKRLKTLRKMLPAHMAKKYFTDLQAMREGKAYDPEGLYLDQPEDNRKRKRRRPAEKGGAAGAELEPGVARRKTGKKGADGTQSRFELVGDEESDEESDGSASDLGMASIHSDSEESEAPAEVSWIGARQKSSKTSAKGQRHHSEDLIDRMLSRAGGATSSRKSGSRRSGPRTGGARSKGQGRSAAGARSAKPRSDSTRSANSRHRSGALDVHQQVPFYSDSEDEPRSPAKAGRTRRRAQDRRGPSKADNRPHRHRVFPLSKKSGFVPQLLNPRERGLLDQELDAELFGEKAAREEAEGAAVYDVFYEKRAQSPSTRLPLQSVSDSRQNVIKPAYKSRALEGYMQSRSRQSLSYNISKDSADAPLPQPDPEVLKEASKWSSLIDIRIDLGIPVLQAGLLLHPDSRIAKGELRSWLGSTEAREESIPSHHFGLLLEPDTRASDAEKRLSPFFDSMAEACRGLAERGASEAHDVLARIVAGFQSLERWIENRSAQESITSICDSVVGKADMFIARVLTASQKADHPALARLQMLVTWQQVRLIVPKRKRAGAVLDRDLEGGNLNALAGKLMIHLLSYGLHRTIRPIKDAAAGIVEQIPEELTIDLWTGLIYLLGDEFWPVFTDNFLPWLAARPAEKPFIRGERIWYALFALLALSQISPLDGSAASEPSLKSCWPLVSAAVSESCIRYDLTVEASMPALAIEQRDGYIHCCLQRILLLSSQRKWKFLSDNNQEGEALVRQVCKTIFDAKQHNFASLPSESRHDFPRFLREFNEGALEEDEDDWEENSFHLFLKLLVRLGKEKDSSSEDANKRLLRFYARLLPVQRLKPDTRSSANPNEISKLINLYSMAAITLFMASDAREARASLRRFQNWLDFSSADQTARLVCIRAVQYLGVICQHHHLPLDDVVTWFEDVVRSLRISVESFSDVPTKGLFLDRSSKTQRNESVRLLKASLRALRRVIENPSLAPERFILQQPLPNMALLRPIWADELLSGPLSLIDEISLEAVGCLGAFLCRRLALEDALKQASTAQQSETRQENLNDSFDDEIWDDALLNDPAFDDVLGVQEAAAAIGGSTSVLTIDHDTFLAEDKLLASGPADGICQTIFRLMSNIFHPDLQQQTGMLTLGKDEAMAARMIQHGRALAVLDVLSEISAKRELIESLVDSWASFAHIQVKHGFKAWDHFLTSKGQHAWQTLPPCLGTRDVGVRFLLNVVNLDPSILHTHAIEVVKVWYRAITARLISVQPDLARALSRPDVASLPFFDRSSLYSVSQTPTSAREEFLSQRLWHLRLTMQRLRGQHRPSLLEKKVAFECLPLLFSSFLEELEMLASPEALDESDKQYLSFVQKFSSNFATDLGETRLNSAPMKMVKDQSVRLAAKLAQFERSPAVL